MSSRRERKELWREAAAEAAAKRGAVAVAREMRAERVATLDAVLSS